MKNLVRTGVVLTSTLLMVACASMPSSGQKRAPYLGQDTVSAVNANSFLGTWRVKVLNPIEGEPKQNITYSYKPNGTVVMVADNRNTGSPMTDMVLEMTGSWKTQEGMITQKLESIRETSGNKFAGMMVGMMNGMKSKLSGSANVYTLEPNRIVLVHEDGERQAQELTRIR